MTQPTTRFARGIILTLLVSLLVSPAAPLEDHAEIGMASWYGDPYHGQFSASGELYDMDELTAAHPTLPFNTRVRVVNLSNDRIVEVRITDRGPFVDGRIIDLSRAAAQSIGLIEPGTARVRVDVIGSAALTPAFVPASAIQPSVAGGIFAVQTGAFRNQENAERHSAVMRVRYGSARILLPAGDVPLWRVLVGADGPRDAADALTGRIRQDSGENNAFVVRLDSSHAPDRHGPSPQPGGAVAADGLHSPSY